MKVDIKSVLIGVLLGINIMLLMGSAPAQTGDYNIGKYVPVYDYDDKEIKLINTTNGYLTRRAGDY